MPNQERSDGRSWDWLYYVNGVEASVGAADYELRGGEDAPGAKEGGVLPRTGQRGIPVVSVNTKSVNIATQIEVFNELEHAYEDGDRAHYDHEFAEWQAIVANTEWSVAGSVTSQCPTTRRGASTCRRTRSTGSGSARPSAASCTASTPATSCTCSCTSRTAGSSTR